MLFRFDNFVASLALLASAIVAVFSFSAIQAIERPRQLLLSDLRPGVREDIVLHGVDCIGKITTTFKTQPETTIVLNGQAVFSVQDKLIPAKLMGGAYFNVLDQFVGGSVSLEAGAVSVHIKIANPNPITLEVHIDLQGKLIQKSFQIPGPIFLRANGDGSYRIDYQVLHTFLEAYPPSTLLNAQQKLHLEIAELATQANACSSGEKGSDIPAAYPLDDLVRELQGTIENWQFLYAFIPAGANE